MEGESRFDYRGEQGGSGGGVPMNLALSARGIHGGHRTGEPGSGSDAGGEGGGRPGMYHRGGLGGEGSGSEGQEEINVEDDGPVHPESDSGALPSHLRADDGGCSSSDDSRKVRAH